MKKLLLLLFIGISLEAFAQHPCKSLKVSISPPAGGCPGTPVELVAHISGTPPYTYLWSPGGETTDTIIVAPIVTTKYTVTVKDSCGDSANKSTTVIVYNPMVTACCNDTIYAGHDTLLVANGNGVISYQWQPASSVVCLNALCDSVQATPTVTTTYTVIGTDFLGCQGLDTVTITVNYISVAPSISESDFVNIYPNPSSTRFTVELQTKALLKLCDITGRIIFSEIENAGTVTFGKGLSPGMYFLFIDGKPGVKLVKQ